MYVPVHHIVCRKPCTLSSLGPQFAVATAWTASRRSIAVFADSVPKQFYTYCTHLLCNTLEVIITIYLILKLKPVLFGYLEGKKQ